MIALNDLTYEELKKVLAAEELPKYRAEQIFRWFSRGAENFDEMTDLAKPLRTMLSAKFTINFAKIEKIFPSKVDETTKFLVKLKEGSYVESVLMRYKHGNTVCVSTQVGCRMGCAFCASTMGGRVRNLTPGEILGQVSAIQKECGERISNIVLMGMGEPLDNYDNVLTFLNNVNNPLGLGIGYRHISLSTCGVVPKIFELAKEKMPITLSISLHAADDKTRSQLMPINKKYNVQTLIDACRKYIELTTRRISFEYILIKDVNDSAAHAKSLVNLLKGMLAHVNLIPANNVSESGFEKSSAKTVKEFENILIRCGLNATVRRELGSDINASCGQLRRKANEEDS